MLACRSGEGKKSLAEELLVLRPVNLGHFDDMFMLRIHIKTVKNSTINSGLDICCRDELLRSFISCCTVTR